MNVQLLIRRNYYMFKLYLKCLHLVDVEFIQVKEKMHFSCLYELQIENKTEIAILENLSALLLVSIILNHSFRAMYISTKFACSRGV